MREYKDWEMDDEQNLTLDVALRLKDITDIGTEKGIFFPHGECTHVALGGHIQTGGYTVLSRSFGMMIDCIAWFEIVTPDCLIRTIRRPNDQTDKGNDDLWFSVLGGSPGNFGVVLRAKITTFRDDDHKNSKAMFVTFPFTKACLKEALDILVEVNDDNDLPADYSYNVMAVSKGSLHKHEVDETMREKFIELYGPEDSVHVPFSDFVLHLGELEQGLLPAMVIVSAVYTGSQDKDVTRADKWLAGIDKRMAPHKKPFSIFTLCNAFMGITDFKSHTPISTIAEKAVWRWAREFDLPFEKRVWAGTSMNLKQRGFSEWCANKCWELESDPNNGCHLATQFIAAGGQYNVLANNQNPSALGHRTTMTNSCAFDFFYETVQKDGITPWPEAYENGKKWLDTNPDSVSNMAIGKNSKYSTDDFRFLYAPWGDNSSSWGHKTNLDDMWYYYFDNKEVYDRILETKLRFDPDHVFTPNSFCVGYNDMMKKRGRSKGEKRTKDSVMIEKNYSVLRQKPDLDSMSRESELTRKGDKVSPSYL
jgi:hypothetical protein